MLTLLVAVTLSAAQPCSEAALLEAAARVQAFDLAGAVERLHEPAASECHDLEVAALYLGGLSAAIDAYKQGGSEESLASIALAAGFADQSHLTRAFKRSMGVTPRAYRRRGLVGPAV